MTEAEILALEGPGLTWCAFSLGLFPAGDDPEHTGEVDAVTGEITYWHNHDWTEWRPHENLAQADALFRSLRTHLGLALETLRAACAEGGWCDVGQYGGLYIPRIYWGVAWEAHCVRQGFVCEKTEALALVRASVLAVVLLGGQ
jgi:hypothetical protein